MPKAKRVRNQNFRDRHLFYCHTSLAGTIEAKTWGGMEPERRRIMAMKKKELEALLRTAFPDGEVQVTDLAGDGDHYKAVVRSDAFAGKSRVEQHKLVYAALGGRMGGALHALALDTAPKA